MGKKETKSTMLQIENTFLIIVDVQGNLAQAMYEKGSLFNSLRQMIRGADTLELPIIWLEQIPEKIGHTIPQVAEHMPEGLEPIPKSSFSACGEPHFVQALKTVNRKQAVVAGIETHICVWQTVTDMLSKGYEVQVLTDCVSSRTLENKQVGLDRIKDAGGKLTTTEMTLFELLKAAEGPKFKEIIKIIK